jgi:hypothetical protein
MVAMKRSEVLYRILIVMFAILVVVGFTIPQGVLDIDNNVLLFLWIVLPIMGWLWIQASTC